MGPSDGGAVVDQHLSVHGLTNLMLADASVFPDDVLFNTNLTCYVIGEVAAELIRSPRGSASE